MTDIVERLQERARGGYAHDELDEEAADEIARLREELRAVLGHVEELRAEIKQLRGTEVLARSSHNSAAT